MGKIDKKSLTTVKALAALQGQTPLEVILSVSFMDPERLRWAIEIPLAIAFPGAVFSISGSLLPQQQPRPCGRKHQHATSGVASATLSQWVTANRNYENCKPGTNLIFLRQIEFFNPRLSLSPTHRKKKC